MFKIVSEVLVLISLTFITRRILISLLTSKKYLLILLFIDEDSNGAIDHEELKKCFHKLEIESTEEEINDLFDACDINDEMGMKFNEFIVLLCLVYLLKDDPTALRAVS